MHIVFARRRGGTNPWGQWYLLPKLYKTASRAVSTQLTSANCVLPHETVHAEPGLKIVQGENHGTHVQAACFDLTEPTRDWLGRLAALCLCEVY